MFTRIEENHGLGLRKRREMFTRIEENHGLSFQKQKTKVTRKRGAPGFRVGVREEQGL